MKEMLADPDVLRTWGFEINGCPSPDITKTYAGATKPYKVVSPGQPDLPAHWH